MKLRGARIIGSAIVVAAGGITMAIGDVAQSSGADDVGLAILVVGGLMFLFDWVLSFTVEE